MKHKILYLSGIFIFLLILFSGCESMDYYTVEKNSSSGWKKENHLVRLVAELRSLELDTGSIWWKDVPEKYTAPKRYSIDPFYAAPILQELDNSTSFSKRLNESQQIKFMQVLRNNLPLYEEEPDIRLVAVGNYYGKGRHLVVLVTKYALEKDSVPGVEKGIMFLTNAYKPSLNPSRKDSGTSFDIKYNAFVNAIPFPEGVCVLPCNLNLGKYVADENMSPAEKADLMDIYLLDEDSDNDFEAIPLYRQVMLDSKSTHFDRACASLNYGLVFFKSNDLEASEYQWNSVSLKGLNETEAAWVQLFLGRDRNFYLLTKAALE